MKIRTPSIDVPDWPPSASTEPEWHEYRVTTITPLYGGGVEAGKPDVEMPIRAAAIRGQLRFWWRLLNRKNYSTSQALFAAERAIWGGMSEKDEDNSSKVRLRIKMLSSPQTKPCANYQKNEATGRYKGTPKFDRDIHSYALFPGQGKLAKGGHSIEKEPADVINPGLRFLLSIHCEDELRGNEILRVLRWWASFGGVGARTRRGLGSVKVEGLSPISEQEVTDQGLWIKQLPLQANSIQAWNDAITRLQKFRQGVDIGRNAGQQQNRPGRSRWPEPDVIRRATGKIREKAGNIVFKIIHTQDLLPRALFGLPIIFHFQGESNDIKSDPYDTQLAPESADRFASPLVLKAVWNGTGFRPTALLLSDGSELLSRNLCLKGADNGSNLPQDKFFESGAWWSLDAIESDTGASSIQPLQNRGNSNPLFAFLDYFEKGC